MELTNQGIYDLLCKIDRGYTPSPEEEELLETREELFFWNKKIQYLPASIRRMRGLRFLHLSDNQIRSLPESLGDLGKLALLNLNNTQITELPESLTRLSHLEGLWLAYTPITRLPDWIGQLQSLQQLVLSGSSITRLPDGLSALQNLKVLGIGGTGIAALPDWLGELPKLRKLDLSRLRLDRIPESLARRGLEFQATEDFGFRDSGINLYGATLREQDISVFLETPELIPELYEAEQVSLKECRVIFLGDGASGKSYTIRRFREEGRRETEQSPYLTGETPGVEILDYPARWEGEDFTLHFWDFGGQQLLHAMHRCFLTQDSCYVVTVKTRETKADQRARYWLRNVEAFAPGSPVLLFVNCWDNDDGKRSIDEPGLRADFPNLKDVRYCSARNAEEAEFRAEIMEPILSLAAAEGSFRRPVPQAWNRVRLALRKRRRAGESFLTKEAYHALCRESGVEDGNAPALLTLFNSLGVCFSYHRDREKRELAAYRLLDPVWLTNALYAIIEEGMSQAQEGRIRLTAIEDMLDNSGPQRLRGQSYRRTRPELCYRREECRYILEVAEAYQLCYRVDENTYFFPALCPNNTPAEAAPRPEDWPRQGSYLFRYAYLPDSVVHRLMVRFLRKDFSVKHCWLKGMVLALPEGFRGVLRMAEDRDLRLELYAAADRPISEFFPLLREEILGVNRDLNLTARELVAVGKDEFPMAQLLRSHQRGYESCFGDKTDREYRIPELLEPFFDPWTLANLEAEAGSIRVRPYEYHRVPKENPQLRKAVWEVYGKRCNYCHVPLEFDELQIDHILAVKRLPPRDNRVTVYLARLKQRGFDLDAPDYVENYFPACGRCNRSKSNATRDAFALMEYHADALAHTPAVLQKLEKANNQKSSPAAQAARTRSGETP